MAQGGSLQAEKMAPRAGSSGADSCPEGRKTPGTRPTRYVLVLFHGRVGELAREVSDLQEPGQGDGIPAIGLDALARPLRDQGGSNAGAVMPGGGDLPLQPIAGGPALVAKQQLAILAGELGDQPPHRLWRMV